VVQHDDHIGPFDGGEIVDLMPGDLEGGKDRDPSALRPDGGRHHHAVVAGVKGGVGDDLGSGNRPLPASAVPPDLNDFFLRHGKPFLPAASKMRER
jgi:hypothetical protein